MDFKRGMYYTMKLMKYIQTSNVSRVKDYMAHLINECPNLNACEVDHKLLEKAMKMVKEKYELNLDWKAGDGVYTVFHKVR